MRHIEQNSKENIDWKGKSWVDREFAHPNRIIRLGTSFSGIGAIEYAFKRLHLNCKIQFAGDIDANCKKSYFANYRESLTRSATNKKINFSSERFCVEIMNIGVPLCIGYSIVGKV